MISVYDFNDCVQYLLAWIDAKHERGLKGQIARSMGVSSTMVSLILKGEKQLSMEQASALSDFIGMNEKETDYFFLLVEFARAGSAGLRKKFAKRIKEQQESLKRLSRRVQKDRLLTEAEKGLYYSSWVYTGMRNLSATGECLTPQDFARRLNISVGRASEVLDFLIEHGFCRRQDGKVSFGPAHLHLDAESPHVIKHHQNWRLQGFHAMDKSFESNFFYTCPMSLSAAAAAEIYRMLPKFIEQVLAVMKPAPSDEVHCLNVDWFKY